MPTPPSPRFDDRRWRRMSRVCLALLPILALFHAFMWLAFTRPLFRPQTGDLKRIGYLVGLEDCKSRLVAAEPHDGFTLWSGPQLAQEPDVPWLIFGDSFAPSLAKAVSLRTHQPVALAAVDWEQGNGLAQIEAWLRDDWFRQHRIHAIILERVEYAWLDTFAQPGDPALNLPWAEEIAGNAPAPYRKATPWTFANNGNFKVLFCNLVYLVSPTAFKMTDTCVVRLKQTMFNCSYGDRLLFYRGDLRGALTMQNHDRLETALLHLRELAELCRAQGITFRLVVPPVKSYLYYPWVERPFYADSPLLENLQEKAAPLGYVDLKQRFRQLLRDGQRDLYYPDDAHWNFPAAEIAAEALTGAKSAQ